MDTLVCLNPKGVTPEKSANRPFEVELHFSGTPVYQVCGLIPVAPFVRQ